MTAGATTVTVELFGVPRLLAGQRTIHVAGTTLAEVATALVHAYPVLAGPVIDPDACWLGDGYIFVINGRFTRDPHHLVNVDSTVLLVSSVAGG